MALLQRRAFWEFYLWAAAIFSSAVFGTIFCLSAKKEIVDRPYAYYQRAVPPKPDDGSRLAIESAMSRLESATEADAQVEAVRDLVRKIGGPRGARISVTPCTGDGTIVNWHQPGTLELLRSVKTLLIIVYYRGYSFAASIEALSTETTALLRQSSGGTSWVEPNTSK